MAVPEIGSLASDKRLLKICENFSGEMKIPFKATLFEKTGKANWLVAFHQDTALPLENSIVDEGWGPSSKKQGINFVHAPAWALSQITAIRIHLDPSTALNGPLRVIPGSHHERIFTDAEYADVLKSRPEVHCLVGKGGVIAMSPLILHASSKAQCDDLRQVLHIEYAKSLDLAPGIKLAIA